MKLTTLQRNLNDALALACRAVPSRTMLPVLHNVLLEAEGNTLTISGTDLDRGVRVPCAARVEVDGACTVPAKRLSDLVATLPPEQVRLTLEDHRLSLECGGVRATFQTIAADEYPPMANKADSEIEVEGAALRAALDHVMFAASTDAAHPVLTGVLMEFDSGELYLAAADGFRLSRTRIPAWAKPDRLIVPAAVLDLVRELSDGPVRIGHRTNGNVTPGVVFDDGEMLVEGSLIDSSFPDAERIVPTEFQTRVLADREELTAAVKRVMIFARDAANIVTLEIPALLGPAQMDVSGDGGESSGRSTVPMTMDGDELMIALNGRFLLDALNAVVTDEVRLSFNGPTKPVMIEEVEGDDAWVHVVMPMALERR